MHDSWYLLYARELDEKDQPKPIATTPLVGTNVVHRLGASVDDTDTKADKDNPLWDMIQEETRPIWAPDLLTLGYAVVFNRDMLPKLAAQMNLRNPDKHKKKDGGLKIREGKKRIYYFDDLWVVGVRLNGRPIPYPKAKDKKPEDWWYDVRRYQSNFVGPYLSPGGVEVTTGIERMVDVVMSVMRSPAFELPPDEEPETYIEFDYPVAPFSKKGGARGNPAVQSGPGTPKGYSGIERFR